MPIQARSFFEKRINQCRRRVGGSWKNDIMKIMSHSEMFIDSSSLLVCAMFVSESRFVVWFAGFVGWARGVVDELHQVPDIVAKKELWDMSVARCGGYRQDLLKNFDSIKSR